MNDREIAYSALLDSAIDAMTELHENMQDDEHGTATIEYEHVRKFVDAHADLLYERNQLRCAAAEIGKSMEG